MTDLFSPPAIKVKLTATAIKEAMSKRWAAPEYAMMWEVGRATGAVSSQRYADAVIMSLWPSRGLELHGVEIKVSRSDWKRESADPAKAEAIAAYCDRWWVHTGPGVIQDLSELPMMWGAREFDGKTWRTLREAEKTEAKACDRVFLASLLRRADGESRWQIDRQAREIADAAVRAADERIESEIARRARDREGAQKMLDEFEAAAGLSMRDFMLGSPKEIGALVRAINAAGINRLYGGLGETLRQLKAAADHLDAALGEPALAGFKREPKP